MSFAIILVVIGGTLGIVYLYSCFAYMHDPDAKKPNWIRKLHGEKLVDGVQIVENGIQKWESKASLENQA